MNEIISGEYCDSCGLRYGGIKDEKSDIVYCDECAPVCGLCNGNFSSENQSVYYSDEKICEDCRKKIKQMEDQAEYKSKGDILPEGWITEKPEIDSGIIVCGNKIEGKWVYMEFHVRGLLCYDSEGEYYCDYSEIEADRYYVNY